MSRAGVSMSSCAKRRGLGDALDAGEVDALGADELGRGRPCLAVAVEAVVGEEPAERLEPGIERHAVGDERVAAGGKLVGGAGEMEAVARPRLGRAPAEDGAARACRPAPAGRASSPRPAAKPIAATQARVAASWRSQPGRQRFGRHDMQGESPAASGAGYSVKRRSHVIARREAAGVLRERYKAD